MPTTRKDTARVPVKRVPVMLERGWRKCIFFVSSLAGWSGEDLLVLTLLRVFAERVKDVFPV
jgi:hypothetical protein